MIFGETPLEEAEGAILAHSLKLERGTFKKGRRLSAEDVAALRAAGHASIIAARLEPGDVHEDEAAARLAEALCGPGLTASAAFTGRCNLIASERGLLVVDRARLDRLNAIHEAATAATLAPFETVEARQMAATIKIIPFAIPGDVLEQCLAVAREGGPMIRVAPFRARRIGLVQTRLPGMKASILDKTTEALNARLAALDCPPLVERRCPHETAAIATEVKTLLGQGCDLVLVSGASAIVDRRDVVPAGIEAAGGTVEHFGMPVDPGNLLLMARIRGTGVGETPVLGLPGCARSPKLNGFDWVLQRLIADLDVTRADVTAMGAGGLLKEIAIRPLPRAAAVEEEEEEMQAAAPQPRRQPRIAALVLAAGRSTRMGVENKLLAEIGGRPMVRQVAEAALASQAGPVTVVTGHEAEKVQASLEGLDCRFVHNPDYAAGLSTSLHRGLAALPAEAEGVVVCLGDMPGIGAGLIDRLVAAFDPLEGRAICIPTWKGKRGNPVLLARRFLPELQAISGDVGAKALLGDYPELVAEVAADDAAVLHDIDTPEALAEARGG